MGCKKGEGRERQRNQEDGSNVESEVSSDKWFIFILALFLIKGWDSELGGLAKGSELHFQEHFVRPASSVLERTCGASNSTALRLSEFLVARFETDTPWAQQEK